MRRKTNPERNLLILILIVFAVLIAIAVSSFQDVAARNNLECFFPPPTDAVVKVMRGNVGGTGFLISPTEVMTPNHVIAGGIPENLEVNGQIRKVTGIQVHPGLLDGIVDSGEDIVILTIEQTKVPFFQLAKAPFKAYERVVAIGYPRSMSLFVVEGLMQPIDEEGDLWTSLHAVEGMSGSPILACRGEWQVVGMLTGILAGQLMPPFGQQNSVYFVSFAIKVGELQKVPRR